MKVVIFKSLMLLTLTLIFTSCQKKNISNLGSKYQQEMRRNSINIEESNIYAKNISEPKIKAPSELLVSTDNTVKAYTAFATLKSIVAKSPLSATAKSGLDESNIKQKKVSKFQILKTVTKARSGLNSNIRTGIILLLIGILVSLFIGWVGSLVALIGIIFIIIGLLDIL